MPLTFRNFLHTSTIKAARRTTTTTTSISWRTFLLLMLISLLVIILDPATAQAEDTAATATVTADQYDLEQYLNTQMVLIDTLQQYTQALRQKIDVVKRKTMQIKAINDVALTDVQKYVNNPLNALTILKRFTSDWHILQQHARNIDTTTEIVRNLTNARKSLKFPSESDFDEAAGNLLRIQGIYQLEPERLSAGEVNGVKLGSAMSWNDCLEIGRKSVQNGDYMIAKFWIEVALGKLPAEEVASALTAKNATEEMLAKGGSRGVADWARLEIMEALVATEFSMGNTDDALEIVNKMLQQQPKSKHLRKVKTEIESELQKSASRSKKQSKQEKEKKMQSDKSVEEAMIEEVCRQTANIGAAISASDSGGHHIFNSRAQHCRLVDGNLPELLLQPLQVEFLSLDPYVVVQHNVLAEQEITILQQLIEEECNIEGVVLSDSFKLRKLIQKKLASVAKRLQLATGHASAKFEEWKADRWTFEDDVHTDPLVPMSTETVANVLLNLQAPKLGGAIVFPQLELGISLPANALLYWMHLNEYHEYDYRSKQHVCPVIAGTQLTAYTSVSI